MTTVRILTINPLDRRHILPSVHLALNTPSVIWATRTEDLSSRYGKIFICNTSLDIRKSTGAKPFDATLPNDYLETFPGSKINHFIEKMLFESASDFSASIRGKRSRKRKYPASRGSVCSPFTHFTSSKGGQRLFLFRKP